MHDAAYAWVAKFKTEDFISILDIGGRDINGTCRTLFPNAVYTVLDARPGPNVHILADAADWDPDGRRWDVVLCTEVFEHAAHWPGICRTAYKALWPGGKLIVTAAGPGRGPHSGIDGGGVVYPDEHYENVEPIALQAVLEECGFVEITVDFQSTPSADVRAVARKPMEK